MHHLHTYPTRIRKASPILTHAVAWYMIGKTARGVHIWEAGHTRKTAKAALKAKARGEKWPAEKRVRFRIEQGSAIYTGNMEV